MATPTRVCQMRAESLLPPFWPNAVASQTQIWCVSFLVTEFFLAPHWLMQYFSEPVKFAFLFPGEPKQQCNWQCWCVCFSIGRDVHVVVVSDAKHNYVLSDLIDQFLGTKKVWWQPEVFSIYHPINQSVKNLACK